MSQVQKKFLANGAIAKMLNNIFTVARNAADSADVNIIKLNASDKIEFGSLPQASGTPSTGNDLVNKTYADSLTGSGATTALDNLASVAINTHLIPDSDNDTNLGSASLKWDAAYLNLVKDGSDDVVADFSSRQLSNGTTVLLDFSGSNLQTSVAPSSGNDLTNKTYVDSVASAQKTWNYEALTLNGTDITNQYKDLAQVAVTGSIDFYVNGVWQRPTTDYTISYTGGAGGKTRLTFAGDLATAGAAALISGDVIHIKYQY